MLNNLNQVLLAKNDPDVAVLTQNQIGRIYRKDSTFQKDVWRRLGWKLRGKRLKKRKNYKRFIVMRKSGKLASISASCSIELILKRITIILLTSWRTSIREELSIPLHLFDT
jgi:hypothetical protein